MIMSPRAMSARQRCNAPSSSPNSEAACRPIESPGMSRCNAVSARRAALARCVSSVTMTTRTGAVSAAEMGFGIVKRLHTDHPEAKLARIAFGVAACLAAHEERHLLQLGFGVGGPSDQLGRCRKRFA